VKVRAFLLLNSFAPWAHYYRKSFAQRFTLGPWRLAWLPASVIRGRAARPATVSVNP